MPVDFIWLADRNIYNEGDSSETIKELADNIEACGLLHPITVNKIAHDNYQIISGERRFRAVTEYLHWKSVPCMVFDGLSAEAAQLKLCMANLAVREYTASQKYRFYLEVKALLEKMKVSGEYKGGMKNTLEALGCVRPFNKESASFLNLGTADEKLYVEDINVYTRMSVTEKGTSKGTGASVSNSNSATSVVPVTLNRPFVFAVVDTKKYLPIVVGAVNHVKES